MSFVIVNVGTEKAYSRVHYLDHTSYPSERGARGVCTRLNKQHGNTAQWKVVPIKEYFDRPVKMVERINLMSGLPYMEAENTPRSCSPASELYWSM